MKLLKLSIVCSLLFLYACEDKVDIDVPEGEEKLVVDGIFMNEPNSVITISKTAPYFNDGHTPRATGATVMITSNAGDTIRLNESPVSPGDYIASTAGEIGKEYTLHIRLAEGDLYQSLPERMNRVPAIDTIYFKDAKDVDDPFIEDGFVVLIETLEPAGKGDYYRWVYTLNGKKIRGRDDLSFASDELVDGNYVPDITIAEELVLGDTVLVQQLSITERAYNFLIAVATQLQVGGPFDSPPSPIKGNIKSLSKGKPDALGYFTVSGASSAEIILK